MEIVNRFYFWIGSLFCHQIPDRTIELDGAHLPMCARDTGIYLGIFIGLLYIILTRRFKADRMPGLGFGIVFCFLMLPMMIDGSTSYLDIRNTNNTIRLLTGTYYGIVIPFLIIPVANFKTVGENKYAVIKRWWEILLIVVAAGLSCMLILKTTLVSWYFLSTVTVFTFLFIIIRFVYTIIARTYIIRKKYWFLVVAAVTSVIIGCMFAGSRFVLRPLMNLLQG